MIYDINRNINLFFKGYPLKIIIEVQICVVNPKS